MEALADGGDGFGSACVVEGELFMLTICNGARHHCIIIIIILQSLTSLYCKFAQRFLFKIVVHNVKTGLFQFS